MSDTKPWYYSRTIWGALIAVLAPLLQIVGLPLSPELQTELADSLVLVVGAAGALVALIGRVYAKSQLR